MTKDPDNNEDPVSAEADSRFINALLGFALAPHAELSAKRVDRVMASIADSRSTLAPAAGRYAAKHRRASWARLAVAAVFLIVVGALWRQVGAENAAHATVLRCLEAARSPGARHYRVTVDVVRPLLGPGKMVFDAYSDGEERYAVRKRAVSPAQELWFGCNGEHYWTLSPEGPQSILDFVVLQRLIAKRDKINVDLILLPASLERMRMSQNYELSSLEPEPLGGPAPGETPVLCTRVRGTRREQLSALPEFVDVWADPETGEARKIILDWKLDDEQISVSKKTIERMPTPDLPVDWFDAEGHATE